MALSFQIFPHSVAKMAVPSVDSSSKKVKLKTQMKVINKNVTREVLFVFVLCLRT